MPSTYAHYQFGHDVYIQLNNEIKKIINSNRQLYLIGLHGPDILFYYKPFRNNAVNQIGYRMHEQTGKKVFSQMLETTKSLPANRREQGISYMLGFLCHFVLDKNCHPYVEEKIHASGVSHAEIEVEYDRMLMLKAHKDPLKQQLTNHIVVSMDNASMIRRYFKQLTALEICDSLQSMKYYNNLLVAPGLLKRTAVRSILLLSGNYSTMSGLLVNYHANPKCTDSNQELSRHYKEAVKEAVHMLSDLYGAVNQEDFVFDEHYDHTFGVE